MDIDVILGRHTEILDRTDHGMPAIRPLVVFDDRHSDCDRRCGSTACHLATVESQGKCYGSCDTNDFVFIERIENDGSIRAVNKMLPRTTPNRTSDMVIDFIQSGRPSRCDSNRESATSTRRAGNRSRYANGQGRDIDIRGRIQRHTAEAFDGRCVNGGLNRVLQLVPRQTDADRQRTRLAVGFVCCGIRERSTERIGADKVGFILGAESDQACLTGHDATAQDRGHDGRLDQVRCKGTRSGT